MARTNNLTNFLTDVSSAIKQKTGDNTPIPASDFDTEILSIETGGNYQSKTLNVTQNGNYNLLPDQEFDALSNVNISVSVSPVLQNKTVTENGSYSADSGYDGLGTVIVNVPQEGSSGDIKLFETEQAMQADPNPSEGDLAVVYRSEVQPCTATARFSKAMFPETVVLDSALEDYVELRFRPVDDSQTFDCWGQLDSNYFQMSCYGEEGEYRIQYESQDGITYTRTRLQDPTGEVTGNELDFGVEIYYEYEEMWNDVIGKFINIGGKYFDGLYEYALNQPVDSFKLREQSGDNYNLVAQSDPGMDAFYSGETIFCGKNVGNKLREIIDLGIRGFLYLSQDLSTAYFVPTQYQNMYIYNNRWAPLVFNSSQTSTDVTYYSYNLTNMSRTDVVVSATNLGVVTDGKVLDLPANSYYLLGLVNSTGTYYRWYVSNTSYYQMYIVGSGTEIEYENKYIIASTQLTLKNANELLPNVIAYGKNGVITGDDTIWNNLSDNALYNITKISTSDIFSNCIVYPDETTSLIQNVTVKPIKAGQNITLFGFVYTNYVYNIVQNVNPTETYTLGTIMDRNDIVYCDKFNEATIKVFKLDSTIIILDLITFEYKAIKFNTEAYGKLGTYCIVYDNNNLILLNSNGFIRISLTDNTESVIKHNISDLRHFGSSVITSNGDVLLFVVATNKIAVINFLDMSYKEITIGQGDTMYTIITDIPYEDAFLVTSNVYSPYTIYVYKITYNGTVTDLGNYTLATNGNLYGGFIDYSETSYITRFFYGAWGNWIHAIRYDIENNSMEYAISTRGTSVEASKLYEKISSTSYILIGNEFAMNSPNDYTLGTNYLQTLNINWSSHTITLDKQTLTKVIPTSTYAVSLGLNNEYISATRLPDTVRYVMSVFSLNDSKKIVDTIVDGGNKWRERII